MTHAFHGRMLSCLCAAAVLLSCAGCGNAKETDSSHSSLSLDSSSSEDSSPVATGTTTTGSKSTTSTRTSTTKKGATTSTSTQSKTTAVTTKSSAAAGTTAAKSAGSSNSGSGSSSSGNSSDNTSSNSGNASDSDTSSDAGSSAAEQAAQNSDDSNASNGSNSADNSSSAGNSNTQQSDSQQQATTEAAEPAPTPATDPAEPEEDNSSSTVDETEAAITITLEGGSASTSDSNAVAISGSTITIQQGGRYDVTGALSDGQICVNVSKEEKVNLHFNGVDIFCSTSAPLYVYSADTCTVHLDEGSVNVLTDSASSSASACLFSKDDLTIKGKGSLIVNGNCKHGIKSNNDLKIKNGNLTVYAVNAGLYGEDSIQITGGSITVPSSKDGFKVSNTENTEKGFFYMEDGYIDVQNAAGNGIEAITGVTISGGTVNLHSAKTAVKCDYQSIAENCLYVY